MTEDSKLHTALSSDASIIQHQICQFIETAIQKNLPDRDIFIYLLEKQYLLSDVHFATEQAIRSWEEKKHETGGIRSMGFAWLVAGLAILMLPMNHNQHQPAYIIAYAVILFGAIKWTHGWLRNNQLKKRLSSVEKWKAYVKTHEQEYTQNTNMSESTPISYSFKED